MSDPRVVDLIAIGGKATVQGSSCPRSGETWCCNGALSRQGVPCFIADVKGDLAGMARPGSAHEGIEARAAELGLADFSYDGAPVVFWDVFGTQGHPFRTTVSDMGPLLLSRLLNLNETQTGVLYIAFRVADEQGLLLLDLKDLRALLNWLDENRKQVSQELGRISTASVGAVQRALLMLEEQGAESFFGEPALELSDLMRTDLSGRGIVNILAAEQLMTSPRLYASALLWLLSELCEELPEVGDPEKPRLVFFFDEAHLLFDGAPKALLDKIEQVVRLIRSKGVGIFFVTQNPLDIPDAVLGQLGNRIQHALRAFTPRDQKAVRAAAETFRPNPKIDTAAAITSMGVGEALVSTLDAKGRPTVVQQTLICPPRSRLDVLSAEERQQVLSASPVGRHYDQIVDRESAYEVLASRADARVEKAEKAAREDELQDERREPKRSGWLDGILGGGGGRRQGLGEAMAKSAVRSIGREIGRRVIRGILGGILR
jgi:DNA helicase HerA-like ATPase